MGSRIFSVFPFLCLTVAAVALGAQAPDGFVQAGWIPRWPDGAGGAVLPGPEPLLAREEDGALALFRGHVGGRVGPWTPEGRLDLAAHGLSRPKVERAYHRFADQWLLLFSAEGPQGAWGLWGFADPGPGKPPRIMRLCAEAPRPEGDASPAEGESAGASPAREGEGPSWTVLRAEGGRAFFLMVARGTVDCLILGHAPAWEGRRASPEGGDPSRRLKEAFLSDGFCVLVLEGDRGVELLVLDGKAEEPRWERPVEAGLLEGKGFLGRHARREEELLVFGGGAGEGLILGGKGRSWAVRGHTASGLAAWSVLPGGEGLALFQRKERKGALILEGAEGQGLELEGEGGRPGLSPWTEGGRPALVLSQGGRARFLIRRGPGDELELEPLQGNARLMTGRSGSCLLQEEGDSLILREGTASQSRYPPDGFPEAGALLLEGELFLPASGPSTPPGRGASVILSSGKGLSSGALLSLSLDGGGRARFLALDDGGGGALLYRAEDRP